MKIHTYYKIVLKNVSPLSVGSGRNEFSDHDCIRHNNGNPYIPASSIAGVFRHYFDGNKSLQNDIFGTIEDKSLKSNVIFYDAEVSGKSVFSIRDSVKLKNKVVDGDAKFDMEVVETGSEFITYIETDGNNYDKQQYIEEVLSALRNGSIRFGTKTSRGYGMIDIVSIKKAEFNIDNPEQLDKWLDFDIFSSSGWDSTEEYEQESYTGKFINIRLRLNQRGAISIRTYTTDTSGYDEGKAPDYKHMTLKNGEPVITGTSWAGAFRERYTEFAGEDAADMLFGYVKKAKDNDDKTITQCSHIKFSESVISDSIMKNITRNSIDRFNAGTKDSALYTGIACYNGKTELSIIIPDNLTDKEKMYLGAVMYDLGQGYLSVGGLTTVGHGIFSAESISVNGIDKTDCFTPEKLADLWR